MKIQNSLRTACLLAMACCAVGVQGASVGPGGYTNSFNVQPSAGDWAGLSIGTSSGTITTAAGLDAAVQAVAAGSITTALVADATVPPAANGTPQWSSTGFYVQTRPTGVDASLLMCTLVNNSGGNASG